MGQIVYTRMKVNLTYKPSSTDDLIDLGRFQNFLKDKRVSYKLTITSSLPLTINNKPVDKIEKKGIFNEKGESEDYDVKLAYTNIDEVPTKLKAFWEIFIDGSKTSQWFAVAKHWYDHPKEGKSRNNPNADWSRADIAVARIHSLLDQGKPNQVVTRFNRNVHGTLNIGFIKSFGANITKTLNSKGDLRDDYFHGDMPDISALEKAGDTEKYSSEEIGNIIKEGGRTDGFQNQEPDELREKDLLILATRAGSEGIQAVKHFINGNKTDLVYTNDSALVCEMKET
ncbi:hypothetical protein [Hydromonas duriensis]|uniref:Uncharacterized protein n=1 Tax=Hydromonas duriensis TaxID=1527608 RepID=A0A4R6XX35_9BURK|nr:hypothetical protein [Hydromonas duriensis]TDR25013.1 hypothetical protein DFR44_1731 [Hydromonas duriensis]